MRRIIQDNPPKCPHCTHVQNGVIYRSKSDHDLPVDGDINVCIFCLDVSIWIVDGDGISSLRKPAEGELESIYDEFPEIPFIIEKLRSKLPKQN